MNQSSWKQCWDDGDIVILFIAITSLIITELLSCFIQKPKQLPKQSLVTNRSKATNALSNTKPKSTSIPKELSSESLRPTPRTDQCTAPKEPLGFTGNQPEVTTRKKTRMRSKDGTTSSCNEDIEEWTFDSVCFTPGDDEVEPDHPDSWLSLLGLI